MCLAPAAAALGSGVRDVVADWEPIAPSVCIRPGSCWWLLGGLPGAKRVRCGVEPGRVCARWLLTTAMGAQLLSTQTPAGSDKTRGSLLASRRAGTATQVFPPGPTPFEPQEELSRCLTGAKTPYTSLVLQVPGQRFPSLPSRRGTEGRSLSSPDSIALLVIAAVTVIGETEFWWA